MSGTLAYLSVLTGTLRTPPPPRDHSKYSHATQYAGRHGGALRVSCRSEAEVGGRTKASRLDGAATVFLPLLPLPARFIVGSTPGQGSSTALDVRIGVISKLP
jgi:hypothetical protein